jgi:hypothetical protein
LIFLCGARIYLFLAQFVWQVSNHDLGGARDTVLRRTPLLFGFESASASKIVWSVRLIGLVLDVGRLHEREDLAGNVGNSLILFGEVLFANALCK